MRICSTIDASGNDPTPDVNNGDGSRVFNIDDGTTRRETVSISGLTLTGGDVGGTFTTGSGGAIRGVENLVVSTASAATRPQVRAAALKARPICR